MDTLSDEQVRADLDVDDALRRQQLQCRLRPVDSDEDTSVAPAQALPHQASYDNNNDDAMFDMYSLLIARVVLELLLDLVTMLLLPAMQQAQHTTSDEAATATAECELTETRELAKRPERCPRCGKCKRA